MTTTTVHTITPDLIGEALEDIDDALPVPGTGGQDVSVKHHGNGRVTVTLWGACGGGQLDERTYLITEVTA